MKALAYFWHLLISFAALTSIMWVAGGCALHFLRIDLQAPSLRIAVGMALLGNLFVWLLLAGTFKPSILLAVLLGTLACGLRLRAKGLFARQSECPDARPEATLSRIGLGAGLVIAVGLLWLSLYPFQGFDFRTYQLPMAAGYAETGGWQWFEDLRFPTFPPLMNLWFATAVLLGSDAAPVLAQLLALLPLFLLSLLTVRWARELQAGVPWWAAAILLGSPVTVWAGTFGFIDLAMTLFTTLSLYCLDRFFRDGGWYKHPPPYRWLVLSGALVGSAMNVKYLGAFFAPFSFIWITASWMIARRRTTHQTAKESRQSLAGLFAGLAAFALPAVAVAAPWYIKTWLATGNPVFPFAKSLFGLNPWGWKIYGSSAHGAKGIEHLFVLLRWDSFAPWLYPIFGLASFLLFRTLWRSLPIWQDSAPTHRRTPSLTLIEAAALSYAAFALTASKDHRYALPSVALLAVLGGIYLSRYRLNFGTPTLNHRQSAAVRLLHRFLQPTMIAFALMSLGLGFLGHKLLDHHSLPPTPEHQEAYLRREIHGLEALRWAQETVSPRVIYRIGLADLTVFHRSERLLGDTMGPYSYHQLLRGLGDHQLVQQRLRQWGVELVISDGCRKGLVRIARNHFGRPANQLSGSATLPRILPPTERTREINLMVSLFEEIHRADGVCVYRLSPTAS